MGGSVDEGVEFAESERGESVHGVVCGVGEEIDGGSIEGESRGDVGGEGRGVAPIDVVAFGAGMFGGARHGGWVGVRVGRVGIGSESIACACAVGGDRVVVICCVVRLGIGVVVGVRVVCVVRGGVVLRRIDVVVGCGGGVFGALI